MIRPQILLSIGLLGSITFFAMFWGETEIATGGITLIGALSMKILEKEQEIIMQQIEYKESPSPHVVITNFMSTTAARECGVHW